jgi:hypothetical protein
MSPPAFFGISLSVVGGPANASQHRLQSILGPLGRLLMSDTEQDRDIKVHLLSVGLVCSHWSYLEYLYELTLWWLLGLLNDETAGRVITGGQSLENLARCCKELSRLRITDPTDRQILEDAYNRLLAIVDERNLAVHGVRSAEETGPLVTGVVSKGKYKSKPQNLSFIRLNTLNTEIVNIMALIEPLLVRLNIISEMTGFSAQQQSTRRDPPN